MKKPNLSDTQLILLSEAAAHPDLRIILPERLRGGPAATVLSLLLAKGMIEKVEINPSKEDGAPASVPGATDYRITKLGLLAIGVEMGDDCTDTETPVPEPDRQVPASDCSSEVPRTGSKLAHVIAMLSRPEAATLDELVAETGWLPHSARAALTGLRKRGLEVERAKREDGTTIYRVSLTENAAQ